MATQKTNLVPENLEWYEELLETIPEIELKGKTMPYTSINGNMFSFLSKEGEISIRLPKEARETFMKQHRAQLSVQHGAIMKEYVAVPENLIKNTEALKKYIEISYEYVKSLKPKPTK
jgi:TfoX/Sxy family transcriptional regulator of competence genes